MNVFSSIQNFFSSYIKPSDKYKKMVVVNNLQVRPIARESQDVEKWRNAMKSAEGTLQSRQRLYELYQDILLDPFLKQCIEKRIRAVTNRRLMYQVDGKEQEQVSRITGKTFFKSLIRHAIEAKFWGHSLIELDWNTDGTGLTKLVNRSHVKPRFGIVVQNPNDLSGLAYRKPPFDKNLIEVGEEEDLGSILEAAFYVILKRGNFGNWADFAEVFGQPFRHGKYAEESSRIVLEEALDKMGAAGWMVTPNDADVNFSYPAGVGQGVDIFQMLHKACNEEIAIGILGNSMTTTEAKYGGYAQGKVQEDAQNEIHKDDRESVLCVLNEVLTPYLTRIGFAMGEGEWSFVEEETMSKKEKLELGEILKRNSVPVGMSWWYETSGIPEPTADDLPAPEEDDDGEADQDDDDDAKQKPAK